MVAVNGSVAAALATALRVLAQAPTRLAGAFGDDPLRLDLPSIGGGNGATRIEPEAVRVLAALYFAAELEQTGLVTVADLLAAERATLEVRSVEAAELLEAFATNSRNWYDRGQRAHLYSRVFGLGPGDGAAPNREFEGLLAGVCSGIVQVDDARRYALTSPARAAAALRRTIGALLANLSVRQFGNTLVATRPIGDQLRAAITLLNHADLLTLVGGDSLWDVVRHVLGADAPDIGRLVSRGQAGQETMRWVAGDGRHGGDPPEPVVVAASQWLAASGFDVPAPWMAVA